ncbi:hypothetical protein [Tardiphaga sp.]|uniref:hypothetical protein n=1 Tax=Tardiphaga sp. TaxID=1926292 RepID=UPI00262382EA|nr:hypothetical protein [Tardiphaga sp.]MDB5617036.1 hypothetical protein [Tardiphaga sp.]
MLNEFTNAYNAAIKQQAKQRNQTVTPFAERVAKSILAAGLLAMEDNDLGIAQYRVVSAPTGSGKSSYAQALIKAYIEIVPDASILYLVETRLQAEKIYRSMSDLIGVEHVAVWTVAHDVGTSPETAKRDHRFQPRHHFSVDDLCNYPVLIVTPGFYTGPRASKAIIYQGKPRQLTFLDERPNAVSIYDVDTGLIKIVRDRLAEQHTSASDVVTRLTQLHDYLEAIWRSASSKSAFDVLPFDPSLDIGWFASSHTAKYSSSPNEQIKTVFGFARALAHGFAFLSRYDAIANGARFIGYDMNMPPTPGMIILDATADIDGLSLIAKNRSVVDVPQVDYSNLAITHIDPEPLRSTGKKKHRKLSEVVKKAEWAQPYADWIRETVKLHTQPGEQVLVVVHKALLDHEYLPANHTFKDPYVLDGRFVCFAHWGTGIGSNEWRNAPAVFLFGEFHKPRRATVATGLGWGEQQATLSSLSPYQAWNRKGGPFIALKDGDLCRWMKQMAMRGNARNIDANGVCGVQRLYVTGELDRLVCHTDLMFPGATLRLDRPETRFQFKGTDTLVALLLSDEEDFLSTAYVKQRTGVDLQKNRTRYLMKPEVQAAVLHGRWDHIPGAGRGRMGGFMRLPPDSPIADQSAIRLTSDVLPSFEDADT